MERSRVATNWCCSEGGERPNSFATQKMQTKTETWGQFHQHFMCAFLAQKFFFCQNVTREKLLKALSYEKRVCKMLMKSTAGSISSTFYEKLLHVLIAEVQK